MSTSWDPSARRQTGESTITAVPALPGRHRAPTRPQRAGRSLARRAALIAAGLLYLPHVAYEHAHAVAA